MRQVHSYGILAEVVSSSQPLTADRDHSGANDEVVTLKVMGAVNVIAWNDEERRRKGYPDAVGLFASEELAHPAAHL